MTYYIHTDVTLKMGKLADYSAMMVKLAPFMARNGWKLIQALQPVTGDFRKVLHIWELEQFADVERGLIACGTDTEGIAILAPMGELVEAEVIRIMGATGYVPG